MAKKQASDRQKYLNQEYARLRRNMLKRMRRREAQGHKVDWSTVPRKPKKVTEKSIRTFEQGIFEQAKTGEYRFKRGYGYMARVEENLTHTQYNQDYTDMIKKNRQEIEAKARAKTLIGVDESREVSPNIASYIERVKSLIESMPDEIGYRVSGVGWTTEDYGRKKRYFLSLVDKAVAEAGEEHMEWYYSMKESEISEATDAENFPSDGVGMEVHDSQLADLLYPYTVTFEIFNELY